jgi:ATP-dependent DNA helicase RecQ
VLRQGTPFYAVYEARPLLPLEELLDRFAGERRRFLADLFAAGRKGRVWYRLDLYDAADRERALRALHYLEQQRLIELRASEARLRFSRIDTSPAEPEALVSALVERFARREAHELERIQQVLALVQHAGCQTNALVAHFGERRQAPCGHCSFCLSGQPRRLPQPAALPPPEQLVDPRELAPLCTTHPDALREPRQQARFLCGLTSPALSRARLGRHPLFGALERHRFGDVLAWCQALAIA